MSARFHSLTTIVLLVACYISPAFAPEASESDNTLYTNFTSSLSFLQSISFPDAWKATNAWEGAVVTTLLSSSLRTIVAALLTYDDLPTDPTNSDTEERNDIMSYQHQLDDYYAIQNPDPYNVSAYAAQDDPQWVVLSWIEAIRSLTEYNIYLNQPIGGLGSDIDKYTQRARLFYNRIQNAFNTSLCSGGLDWNLRLEPYKNAITNELFISSSMAMYLYWPGIASLPNITGGTGNSSLLPLSKHDPLLLENAKKGYNWFMRLPFFNATTGLVIDGFHIKPNQTTCNDPNPMVYTYNQGVILPGLRQLWESTGDTKYLQDGYRLISKVIAATGWKGDDAASSSSAWSGLGRRGVLEDYCDTAQHGCDENAQSFKGIYFHTLRLFCEPLPTTTATVPGLTFLASRDLASAHSVNCQGYQPWVEHNARTAMTNKDRRGIIGGWWGALLGADEWTGTEMADPFKLPDGAMDYRNHPEILNTQPWRNVTAARKRTLQMSIVRRQNIGIPTLVYGFQTQAAGVSVIKTAWDLTHV